MVNRLVTTKSLIEMVRKGGGPVKRIGMSMSFKLIAVLSGFAINGLFSIYGYVAELGYFYKILALSNFVSIFLSLGLPELAFSSKESNAFFSSFVFLSCLTLFVLPLSIYVFFVLGMYWGAVLSVASRKA